MISEIGQIHTRLATGCRPSFRISVRLIPIAAVTELAGDAETLNIFHERAGIIELHAPFREPCDGAQRVLRPILICGDSIIQAEDLPENFRTRMWTSPVLRLNRIPGVLIMITARALVRPIDRLMQVPKK